MKVPEIEKQPAYLEAVASNLDRQAREHEDAAVRLHRRAEEYRAEARQARTKLCEGLGDAIDPERRGGR